MAELYKSVTELMKTARGNKALQGNLGDITDFQQIIDDTPTADVEEVKHGYWENGMWCSVCGYLYDTGEYTNANNYCPDCGAKTVNVFLLANGRERISSKRKRLLQLWEKERYIMAKYHNKKIEIDGVIFDSRKEAKRYKELSLLERAGAIQDLQTQVKFVLIPTQREPDTIGKRGGIIKGKVIEKECAYIADFVYMENGDKIVEDTKGFKTKDYIIKRKLMLYIHNIRVKEV
jgi:hypothetical protein